MFALLLWDVYLFVFPPVESVLHLRSAPGGGHWGTLESHNIISIVDQTGFDLLCFVMARSANLSPLSVLFARSTSLWDLSVLEC